MRGAGALTVAVIAVWLTAGPADGLGLVLAAFAGWVILVLARPHRLCTWCGGTRRARRYRWWGRTGKCRRCKGNQRHRRLGASTVHRAWWAILGERLQAARLESLEGKSACAEQADDDARAAEAARSAGGRGRPPSTTPGPAPRSARSTAATSRRGT